MLTVHGTPIRFRSLTRVLAGAACLVLTMMVTPAWCQTEPPPHMLKTVSMAGPRFGITMLSQGNLDVLKKHDISVRPVVSQFGWQFEKRVYTNRDGLTALTEFVPLVSGLEQGVVLPSLNWLVGVRSPSGLEFGIGPNITPLGVGLVVAGGVTVRSGALNVPLTFAVATSRYGSRVTILTGFNLRR